MRLALFDLDHTLLDGDSDQLWGDFLYARQMVDSDFQQHKDRFFRAYHDGTLDIVAFAEFVLRPLRGQSRKTLLPLREEFASTYIAPRLRTLGKVRWDWHLQQGDRCVIVTATNRFLAEAAAELMQCEDLIATEPELLDDIFSGKITGTPAFRGGKVELVRTLCTRLGCSLSESYFYSDSHNDLPLLQAVTFPHAVTPDALLRRAAIVAGWPILSW